MGNEIITQCPVCGEQYWVSESAKGLEAECEECGTPFFIESPSTTDHPGEQVSLPFPDLKFIRIKAGHFYRGSNEAYLSDYPKHRVSITYDYWVSVFPTTQRLYESVIRENPSKYKNEQNPVENVNWHEAQEFCNQLTQIALEGNMIPEGFGFRLPTGAEWENIFLETEMESFNRHVTDYAWIYENSNNQPHPVGEKKPTERGVHDIIGNVGEWCFEWYDYYSGTDLVDPTGIKVGIKRVRRGGCFSSSRPRARITDRIGIDPSHRSSLLGFRIVMVPR